MDEYNYLIQLYVQLVSFEPISSTFQRLMPTERENLLIDLNKLKLRLEEILPKVQNRG